MEWNNCLKNTLCFHGQEEFEYREECNLMGFQTFRYINIELNFWIEWIEHVECFWSSFGEILKLLLTGLIEYDYWN